MPTGCRPSLLAAKITFLLDHFSLSGLLYVDLSFPTFPRILPAPTELRDTTEVGICALRDDFPFKTCYILVNTENIEKTASFVSLSCLSCYFVFHPNWFEAESLHM